MLEKIGLPAKPSMRGNTWVVDASNCQGCSSQFTFINRKHHCRRCGGIFCSSCTQQRMVLRGQGDSAVRICDPCKKLEEAARFEMRHGHKNKTGRGGSKQTSKDEDDVLKQILGADRKQSLPGKGSISNMVSDLERGTSNASCSNFDESLSQDGKGAVDTRNGTPEGIASGSPEELWQQALEEKKKHKILKGEGKPEEALKAFKRGKELEREAKALEVALRKSQRKALSSSGSSSIHTVNADPEESGRKGKVSSQMHREGKDDLAAELRELGWSDADLHDADKKPAKISLEGELSSLIGEVHTKPGASKQAGSINKTEVIALKKKALMFKREGKLGEAKEELKRAKVLEQKLEEQELLAGAEDSDDELSSLIHSMDDDKQDDLSLLYQQDAGFDSDHLLQDPDDFGLDGGFDVTDQDMDDPEMAAALNALGWTEELKNSDLTAGATAKQSVPMDGKALLDEALSLKKEAVRQKRSGNSEAAMTLLRKAKLLEKDAESFQKSPRNSSVASQSAETSSLMEMDDGFVGPMKHVDAKLPGKSKLVLQKELLALKKKALALRREGRVDEAEEELKKGRVLECQLEGMESTLKVKAANVKVGRQVSESMYEKPNKSGDMGLGEEMDAEDVTDQDMHDPALQSLLENLGWKDEEEKSESLPLKPAKGKLALQKELLGIKKKALALRREGRIDEAEEELKKGRVLECQLEEMDSTTKVRATNVKVGSQVSESIYEKPNKSGDMGLGEEVDAEGLTDQDMHDPALLSLLENLGWKDEEEKSESLLLRPSKQIGNNPDYPADTSVVRSPETPLSAPKRSKAEIQRELLGLKRKALTLRRQGEAEEAEEILRMAKVLEAQMAEIEAPKRELPPYTGNDEVSGLSKSFDHVGSGTSIPPRSSSNYDHGSSPAVADTRITEPGSSFHQADQLDLLTGGSWNRSELDREEKEKESTSENISSLNNLYIQPGSSNSPNKEIVSKNEMSYDRWGKTHSTIEKMPPHEANLDHISDFQSNPSNIQYEVLVHKRRAVALKKEGKLAEAREELRRAKLLEKSPEKDAVLPDAGAVNASSSASNETLTVQDDQKKAHQAPKAMTGRDRFKLQQKSLAHKRQALKLRREGKIEEAEAEFQLAKALENQLEELAGNDPINLNKTIDVTVENNNLGVEDLLDPQLLSALKAIGLQDAEVVPQVSSRSEDTKVSTGKVVTISPEKSELKIGLNDTLNQEKIQLEERIRAEKVKAVSLKRAGKQAEALDSLRRAKLYEKKLSSLA